MSLFCKERGSEIKASIAQSPSCDDPVIALKNAAKDAFCKLTDHERDEFARRAALQAKATLAKKEDQSVTTILGKPAACSTPFAAIQKVASRMNCSASASTEKSIKENQDNGPGYALTGVVGIPRKFTSIKDTLQTNLQPSSKEKKKDSPKATSTKQASGVGKPPAPVSKPSATTSASKANPTAPKGMFFMTPVEKEAKEQQAREEQSLLLARKRQQEFIEERERRRREDSEAFVSTGIGEHKFFLHAKESITASAEARLIRRDSTESGLDEADAVDAVEYTMTERFPVVQHAGLPHIDFLSSHCMQVDSSFAPVDRSPVALLDSDLGNDAGWNTILGSGSGCAPSLGAVDNLRRLNLVAHFANFISSFLPVGNPSHSLAGVNAVIDLCEDGGSDRPIEILGASDTVATDQAVATIRAKSGCYQSLVDLCKPGKAAEYIGNAESIKQLEEWLMTWAGKSRTPSWMKQKAVSEKQRNKSKYEYESSDEEEEDNICNVATLYGPSGTGKTALVSALAKEIGYNVIEIRANELRSGAAVKKMFAEATKSHGLGLGAEKGRKKSSKSVLNLILFDEIDLDFEEDVGFHQAIQALAKSTRTPIVLTTENEHLPFLGNIQTEYMFIDKPSVAATIKHIASILRTTETLSDDCAEQLAGILVNISKCDIRRSLHQLHLSIPSFTNQNRSVSMAHSFQRYLCDVGVDFARFDKMPTLLYESSSKIVDVVSASDIDIASQLNDILGSLNRREETFNTPSVFDVTPRRGDRRGGFVVTVDGKSFLQRTHGGIATIHVLVGGERIPDENVRVLSDTEIAFLAPCVPSGGVLSVVVALELNLAQGKGCVLLRSDTRGIAGSLHFELPPQSSDIRYYFGKHSSKAASNQLTLSVKRRTWKRTSEYIDSSSDEAESTPPEPKRRATRLQPKELSDDEELAEPGVTATGPQIGGSGSKRRRMILDDDEDCASDTVSPMAEGAMDAVGVADAVECADEKTSLITFEKAIGIMTQALDLVMKHPHAAPFLEPVSNEQVPDYSNFISRPMDLGTIATKCEEGVYMSDDALSGLEAMAEDVRLVWSNCYTYNKASSSIYASAQHLSKIFEGKLQPCLQELGITPNAVADLGDTEAADDRVATLEVIDLVQSEEENPYVEEVLPERPAEEFVQASLLVAELKRAQDCAGSSRSYGSSGEEYDQCLLSAFPPCLPELLSLGACKTSAKEKYAVHRGNLAALELLSSIHDVWAAADILGACAMRAETEDEVHCANMCGMVEPMARCLATANLSEMSTWSQVRLGNEFSFGSSAQQQLSKYAFLGSIEQAAKLPAEADNDRQRFEVGIEVSCGQSTSTACPDPAGLEQGSSDDDQEQVSKRSRASAKSRRNMSSSDSEEEAQFGNGNDDEYAPSRPLASGGASAIPSSSPRNFLWRKCGVEFEKGYLRYEAKRDAYTTCISDELSTKALTVDQWKVFGSGAGNVPRHVAVETIPLLGKMIYWDSVFGVSADSRSSSSRRSARATSATARFPYTSRVTRLQDDILDKIAQFSRVGEPWSQECLLCAWE